MVSTIGVLDILTVVVIDTVTIIVAVNVIAAHTMALTFIGVVSNRRRASSWVVSRCGTRKPARSTSQARRPTPERSCREYRRADGR